MAVLTPEQLVSLRQAFEREGDVATWGKADLNAALQAIEDWWETNQAGREAAINAATAPLILSADVKQKLGKHWQQHKHGKGG